MKLPKPDVHLLIVSIAALIFVVAGGARVLKASNDFVPVYTGARCLLQGCNPYDTAQLEREFYRAGGQPQELPSWQIDVPVYPPSTFLVLSPLALMRFPVARVVWFLLNSCLFITATFLILAVRTPAPRWVATSLASLVLLSCSILLVLGQPALFAISLAVIGSCLLLAGRREELGTVALILSFAVKPQLVGLLVLYFLTRKAQWRSAVLICTGALGLLVTACGVLTTHPQSMMWPATLRSNLSATLDTGGSADPRPANPQAIGDTNLQALSSIFLPKAHEFNAAAYGVFVMLFGLWALVAFRTEQSPWLALGALAVLSLTPIYHRFYDTRLLLISIPALLVVWQRRRILAVAMCGLTLCAVVSVQYRVQLYLLQHAQWQNVLERKLLFVLLLRQQNLEILALFGLYLFALFALRIPAPAVKQHAGYSAMSVTH
jgi:hypothetical protein